ncbi:unannotated protein [freshwater metagenome]|uniref:Unannotated protein n=1 Tax=freshwater metagenome TaxID=449393 RepID=A0A6J5ZXN9_9ZZZZ
MAEQVLDAAAHYLRRFVRERDRENLTGARASCFNQPSEPMGQYARLPGTCACQYQQRAAVVSDGFALRVVQSIK